MFKDNKEQRKWLLHIFFTAFTKKEKERHCGNGREGHKNDISNSEISVLALQTLTVAVRITCNNKSCVLINLMQNHRQVLMKPFHYLFFFIMSSGAIELQLSS